MIGNCQLLGFTTSRQTYINKTLIFKLDIIYNANPFTTFLWLVNAIYQYKFSSKLRQLEMGDFKTIEDISLFQYKMETESLTMTVYVLKFCF